MQAAGLASTFKAQVGGLAGAARAVLATAGIGVFVRESVNAASDLNESLSKVNVVFREGAGEVDAWSKTTATGLGLSRQAALEAAGTFGNFLISMGLVPAQAQQMSVSMVKLAADLASFNNTSPEEALLAIRSGLAGEIEPLRRYGVALSAARLENEAAAQGINKTSAEMSAAEKATLSYQIILKDTALAQGDFERTSGGLANQQRILAARLKDAEAQLGAFLVPLLLTAAKAATALGHALAVANKATDGWIGTLGGAAVLGGTVFLTISKIGSVVRGLGAAFTAQTAATSTLTAAEATNVGVTQANVVAQGELAVASGTAAVAMDGESVSAGILGTTLKGTLAPALAAVAIGFLGGKKAGDELNSILSGNKPEVDRLTAGFISLSKGIDKSGLDVQKFADDFDHLVGRGDLLDPSKRFQIFTGGAHRAKDDAAAINEALKSVLQTEGVDAATLAYGRFQSQFIEAGGSIDALLSIIGPFFSALDLARAKEEDVGATTQGLTADFTALADVFAKESAPLSIADQFDAAQSAIDDLNQLKLDAQGQGQKSIDAARNERNAQDRLSDAYKSQENAAESLSEAKQKLAQFDGPTDQRIRQLERQNISERVVTTPEEARQKEIDLLRFDEDAVTRRAELQNQVSSAEDGVASAADRVADAQRGVSEAAAARRQVQTDAAAAIQGAERKAEEAILAAGDAVLKAKDDQLIGNDALGLYLQLLDDLGVKVDPGSELSKKVHTFLDDLKQIALIKASLGPAGFVGPQGDATKSQFAPAPPAPPTGPPAKATTLDYHPQVTVVAPDQPSRQTLDSLNRKQAIRLAGNRVLT